mmetsp:Transcript_115488/g.274485  ORF Transcript_115488/g.274485 Transcript_115488/m.274485 type:complete len:89 (-) Transcript_115488:80-346(-)
MHHSANPRHHSHETSHAETEWISRLALKSRRLRDPSPNASGSALQVKYPTQVHRKAVAQPPPAHGKPSQAHASAEAAPKRMVLSCARS